MMAAKQMPPTPGGAGPGADKSSEETGQYSQAAAKASQQSRPPALWYRARKADLRRGLVSLDLQEKGLARELIDELDDRGEPMVVDVKRLAKRFGTTKPRMERMLDALIETPLFHWSAPSFLWSDYVVDEIEFRAKTSDARRKNANVLWEKRKQNQRPSDANAYREESTENRSKRAGPPGPAPRADSESVGDNSTSGSAAESVDKPHRPSAPEAQAGAAFESETVEQGLYDLLARHTDDHRKLPNKSAMRRRAIELADELDQAYPRHVDTINSWLAHFTPHDDLQGG